MHIIPQPERIQPHTGVFQLKSRTTIHAPAGYRAIADELAGMLKQTTGRACNVQPIEPHGEPAAGINLIHDPTQSMLGEEGYALAVTADRIVARSSRPAGAFYACQTLRQLIPAPAGNAGAVAQPAIPQVEIVDRPRFPWRGFMLDSARHFQDKEFIKRLLDTLAFYKINRLHWHLCDSQGWRLEIEAHPELTVPPDGRKNDFYSRDDIREILAHAGKRHIRVYPEIEMPGHSLWALSLFKELQCENARPPVHEYCLGSEKTERFLKTVLNETINLFPDAVIHLGGDEADTKQWQACPRCRACMNKHGLENERMLQKWFMQKMTGFVHAHNRGSIAWADHQELGWPSGQIVQGWIEGGSETAIRQGFKTVNSQHTHVYFDYPIAPDDPLRSDWMPLLPLEKVYAFDPVPAEATPAQAALVLGSEACLWTENFPQNKVNEKTFPRLQAFSETVWSPQPARDWESFRERVATHSHWLNTIAPVKASMRPTAP